MQHINSDTAVGMYIFWYFIQYCFPFSGLIKEIQDNYDWMLANFGNYTISDMIERSTPDCITTPPVKYRQYGRQGETIIAWLGMIF